MSALPGVSTWRPTPPCAHRTRTPKLCLICRALARQRQAGRWEDFQAKARANGSAEARRLATIQGRLEAVRRALDARLGINPCQDGSDVG